MQKSKEVLEKIVKSIVERPDDVSVTDSADEMGVLLTLDVDRLDMGRVIGRSGQTVTAIRAILRVVGATENARISLKINDPRENTQSQSGPANTTEAEPSAGKSYW